jgi:hypothetical protein
VAYSQYAVRIDGWKRYLIGFRSEDKLWVDLGEFAGTDGGALAQHVADLLNVEAHA